MAFITAGSFDWRFIIFHYFTKMIKTAAIVFLVLIGSYLGVQACAVPSGLSSMVTVDSVHLQWSNTGANSYTLQYRAVGTASWTNLNVQTNGYSVTGFAGCSDYVFKVRSVCSTGTSVFSPTGAFSTGCASCTNPYTTLVNSVSDNTAMVSWSGTPLAMYKVRYRAVGTTVWTAINVVGGSLTINGLNPCTAYHWRVARVCNGVPTSYTIGAVINTTGCADSCLQIPTPALAPVLWPCKIIFIWTLTGAPSYRLQFREIGTTAWTTQILTTNSDTVDAYLGEIYEFRVRSECSVSQFSGYSSLVKRSTICNFRLNEPESSNERLIRLYPNPATSEVTLYLDEPLSEVGVVIFDMEGRVVKQTEFDTAIDGLIKMDVSDVSPGVYVLKASATDQPPRFGKLVVH